MVTALWSVALVLLGVAALWLAQRRLIYFPLGGVPAPAAIGLREVEPATLTTGDGVALGGWFFRASRAGPGPAVLVFNGNAGNRTYRAALGEALRRDGFHVLLFDYRGYGGNRGSPTEAGLALDSRAAREYLVGRSDVDASRLVYFGESLGSAAAVELATEHPPAALILRSPFTSLADVGQLHYPFLPVGILLRDRYGSIDRIAAVRAPVLIIAGSADRIVPAALSRRLYDAAGEPKRWLELQGADHNDPEMLMGEQMMEGIREFLRGSRVSRD